MPSLSFTRAARGLVLAALGVGTPAVLAAQATPAPPGKPSLTLAAARAAARETSPDLRALREGVTAATGRERQAGALPNPTLAYNHEQTSRDGRSNAQHIAQLEQPLELAGQRGARRDAARFRRLAAEARLAAAEAQLDFEVTRAYTAAVAADRRATLAGQAAEAFTGAQRVSQARLAAGDISGYADRRLRLEAARYAALRAEAAVARRAARVQLATLVGGEADLAGALVLADTLPAAAPALALPGADSLARLALARRAELRAATLEADAAAAEARLTARERLPVPVLSAGIKTEQVADAAGSQSGFRGLVAGVSIPLPLFDRRGGAVAAADADARRQVAEADALRRRVVREVAEAEAALRAVGEEIGALAPQVGAESEIALRAARTAYAEGEITLAEFLDAVRAYQEAEASYATLRAEVLIRRAALERAVGSPVVLDAASGGQAPQE